MVISNKIEDKIETAYWKFDSLNKGYGGNPPMSERDAFKWAVRSIISSIPEKKPESDWSEP